MLACFLYSILTWYQRTISLNCSNTFANSCSWEIDSVRLIGRDFLQLHVHSCAALYEKNWLRFENTQHENEKHVNLKLFNFEGLVSPSFNHAGQKARCETEQTAVKPVCFNFILPRWSWLSSVPSENCKRLLWSAVIFSVCCVNSVYL